jgi:chaperone modulatory protein CbpM
MSTFALQPSLLTIDELCLTCAVRSQYILELIQEGVIDPLNDGNPEDWRFSSLHERQTKLAWRLQRDLGVNMAGVALALQLLDELEELRAMVTDRPENENRVIDA